MGKPSPSLSSKISIVKFHERESPLVLLDHMVKVVLARASVGVPLISPVFASSIRDSGKSGEIS